MIVYAISPKKAESTLEFLPELTCSEWAAQNRKEELEKQGYQATITPYEVKTQGVNFHSVATKCELIKY